MREIQIIYSKIISLIPNTLIQTMKKVLTTFQAFNCINKAQETNTAHF